jgi:hypothetical protein
MSAIIISSSFSHPSGLSPENAELPSLGMTSKFGAGFLGDGDQW